MEQYLNLLRKVREEGVFKGDRTGTGTYSIFGHQLRFDLSLGFPLVTTKKVHLASIIKELLWFIRGDTNISYLKKNGVRIWNEWANTNSDLGPVYSAQWRRWPIDTGDVVLIDSRVAPKEGPVEFTRTDKNSDLLESEYTGDLGINHCNNGSPFRIIKELGTLGGRNMVYQIQFDDTGYITTVGRPTIRGNKVKNYTVVDPYSITLFGVACLGKPTRNFDRHIYDIWYNMLARCYNPNNLQYSYYGSKGIYVAPRWLCFENFLDDISTLPYYEEWCQQPHKYHLDKDYYGSGCYSKDTCIFINSRYNKELASSTPIQCHYEGKTKYFVSKRQLCDYYGVTEETLRNFENGIYKDNKLEHYVITPYTGNKLVRRKLFIDQVMDIQETLKVRPQSRRIILSAWNPSALPDEGSSFTDNVANVKQALPACHTLVQFITEPATRECIFNELNNRGLINEFITTFGDFRTVKYLNTDNRNQTIETWLKDKGVPYLKLSCQLYQRSADCALGVPFNIASYATLTMMYAQVCNMYPGEFVWTGGDVHIYSNHLELVDTQLTRTPHKLPTLKINKAIHDIRNFEYSDFIIENYESHSHISAKVAV